MYGCGRKPNHGRNLPKQMGWGRGVQFEPGNKSKINKYNSDKCLVTIKYSSPEGISSKSIIYWVLLFHRNFT